MKKGVITQEELDELKGIAEKLQAMHEKNSAVRFLLCYDQGETSAVARAGTDRDMAIFISAFVNSDEDAKLVIGMVMMSSMFGSDDDEHSS